MKEFYTGLMSGTSADGVDAALVSVDGDGAVTLERALHRPWPAQVRAAIEALLQPGANEIERAAQLDIELGRHFAEAALAVIAPLPVSRIAAIGSHGQTVRHASARGDTTAYTVQLGSGAVIAEITGITTINDFRSRDIAAGGEGAPLAPAFHEAVFRDAKEHRAIINIGGIANLSRLVAGAGKGHDRVTGFDTGPGNTLLDLWIQKHQNQPFDKDGAWALSGTVQEDLLREMLNDPYFAQAAPKSTGREYFNAYWLRPFIERHRCQPADVQATLAALSTDTIALAVQSAFDTPPALDAPPALYLCGGGAHNPFFARRLSEHHGYRVATTAALGMDPDAVEAAAFGWFAARTLHHKSGNAPGVTGARHEVVLGAVHAAAMHRQ